MLCSRTNLWSVLLFLVPCVPTNVSVVMDCANNIAVVSWSASRGAVQYSVTARGSHSNDSCQTSGLNCSLNSLTCGSQYTVEVVAISDNCSSIPSQAVLFKSGKGCIIGEQLSAQNVKLTITSSLCPQVPVRLSM